LTTNFSSVALCQRIFCVSFVFKRHKRKVVLHVTSFELPIFTKQSLEIFGANVSKKWIGLHAEDKFEAALKRDILFVIDADAAGVAESASIIIIRAVAGFAVTWTRRAARW